MIHGSSRPEFLAWLVGKEGFEPSKLKTADLQSAFFVRLNIYPNKTMVRLRLINFFLQNIEGGFTPIFF